MGCFDTLDSRALLASVVGALAHAGEFFAGGMTVGQGSVMSWVAVRHALGVKK